MSVTTTPWRWNGERSAKANRAAYCRRPVVASRRDAAVMAALTAGGLALSRLGAQEALAPVTERGARRWKHKHVHRAPRRDPADVPRRTVRHVPRRLRPTGGAAGPRSAHGHLTSSWRSFPDLGYERANPDFYRDVATWAAFSNLYRQVRLVIENTGPSPAEDVRVEIEVDESAGVSLQEHQVDDPVRMRTVGDVNPSIFRNMRGPRKEPGDIQIIEFKGGARLEVDCGKMQPSRRVWSEKFYVAVRESGQTALSGRIFAATLKQPMPFELTIDAAIKEGTVPAQAIREHRRQAHRLSEPFRAGGTRPVLRHVHPMPIASVKTAASTNMGGLARARGSNRFS